ncbi:hypothetical protein SAMN06265355_10465 [Actinomadura mexicana]|uniref:Uncharacterized protein n=1 Tax=Actinomadura mexicana TaxID=134959 RepID=A0A238X8Y1_9ACTN|nr:hypothetical protein SAMN06265355_10465 [Actinomadura mexicana]
MRCPASLTVTNRQSLMLLLIRASASGGTWLLGPPLTSNVEAVIAFRRPHQPGSGVRNCAMIGSNERQSNGRGLLGSVMGTAGSPGGSSGGGGVSSTTRRRTRRGCRWATRTATAPPIEWPTRSARSIPLPSRNPSTSSPIRSSEYVLVHVLSPCPRRSKARTWRPRRAEAVPSAGGGRGTSSTGGGGLAETSCSGPAWDRQVRVIRDPPRCRRRGGSAHRRRPRCGLESGRACRAQCGRAAPGPRGRLGGISTLCWASVARSVDKG